MSKTFKRGDTFTHAYNQERLADGSWVPAVCTVTTVRNGIVYYKLANGRKVHGFGLDQAVRFVKY